MTIRHNCAGEILGALRKEAKIRGVKLDEQIEEMVAKAVTVGCYKERHLPDFGTFSGCFGPSIKPTDIDFLVERKGHLLLAEFKKNADSVPWPQQETLFQFAKKKDCTAIIVEVPPPSMEVTRFKVVGIDNDWRHTDTDGLRRFFKEWFYAVNRQARRAG